VSGAVRRVPLTERRELDPQAVEDALEVAQDEVVARVAQRRAIDLRHPQLSDLLEQAPVGQRLVQPVQGAEQPVDAVLRVIFDVLPVTLEGQRLVVRGQRLADTSLGDEHRRAT